MGLCKLLQSLLHTLALRLTKLYLGTTKLRFLHKNLAELTEFSLNLDITFQWKLWFQCTTVFFSRSRFICSTIWCYTSQKNIMEIFILQKRCMRLITFSNFQEHNTPIFKNFKILKLQDIMVLLFGMTFSEILIIIATSLVQVPLNLNITLMKFAARNL